VTLVSAHSDFCFNCAM